MNKQIFSTKAPDWLAAVLSAYRKTALKKMLLTNKDVFLTNWFNNADYLINQVALRI